MGSCLEPWYVSWGLSATQHAAQAAWPVRGLQLQGLVASSEEKMEDMNKETVAHGATMACEVKHADSCNMLTDNTMLNMQATASQYNAGGPAAA